MIPVTRPGPPAPHPFKTYKDKHVVAALKQLFLSKCAYCESRITATAPIEIEHYRPKGRVLEADGKVRKGYKWLALEWTNLLPSCIDCNRERHQDLVLPGGGTARAKGGKACKFPLRDPKRRARKKGDERFEAPLLIDPCEAGLDPHVHWWFTDNGSVQAATIGGVMSERGFATIEVTGLHRSGLAEWRRMRLLELEEQMQKVCEKSWRQMTDPSSPFHAGDRKTELEALRAMASPDKDYSTMAAQVVRHFDALLPLLEEFVRVQLKLRATPASAPLLKREAAALAALQPFAAPDHPLRDLSRRIQEYFVGKLPVN